MEQTLPLASQSIAVELRSLIKQLESAQWLEELEHIHSRFAALSQRIKALLLTFEKSKSEPTTQPLYEDLSQLAGYVEQKLPDCERKEDEIARQEWFRFRERLCHVYDAIASSLKRQNISVPSLRPSNPLRSTAHICNGVAILALIQYTWSWGTMKWIALGAAVMAWGLEFFRPRVPQLNAALMKVFGPIAHPHEHHQVNSGTWYITALLVISLTVSPLVASVAVMVLAIADPAAAVIGRLFGRLKLVKGKTLEGTLTFLLAGMGISALVLSFYGQLSGMSLLVLGFGAALPGALAELFSQRVDDNLSIPLAVSAGLFLTSWLIGVPV